MLPGSSRHLNDQGFSLVSVMIAGAIGLIIIYAMMEAITFMNKGTKAAAVSSVWNEFYSAFDRMLKYDDTCGAVLEGIQYPVASGLKINIVLKMPYNGKPGPIAPGFIIANDLSIESITLTDVTPAGGPRLIRIPDASNNLVEYRRHLAQIEIMGRKVQTNLPGGAHIKPRDTTIPVLVDNGGAIRLCHGENSVVESCIAGGGTWAENNPPEQRCVPQSFCKHGGSYAPNRFINPLTGGFSCPSVTSGTPYQPMLSGMLATVTSCGKNCVDQEDSPVYQCLKCN